jgi:hypothetical protein
MPPFAFTFGRKHVHVCCQTRLRLMVNAFILVVNVIMFGGKSVHFGGKRDYVRW